jgi:hypothetical protein
MYESTAPTFSWLSPVAIEHCLHGGALAVSKVTCWVSGARGVLEIGLEAAPGREAERIAARRYLENEAWSESETRQDSDNGVSVSGAKKRPDAFLYAGNVSRCSLHPSKLLAGASFFKKTSATRHLRLEAGR